MHVARWPGQRYAGRFEIVNFEALVDRPEATLTSALSFLGETLDQRQFTPEIPSGVVLPRSMPWKGAALGPIDPNATGRRSAAATRSDLAFLERTLGRQLRSHGYDAR